MPYCQLHIETNQSHMNTIIILLKIQSKPVIFAVQILVHTASHLYFYMVLTCFLTSRTSLSSTFTQQYAFFHAMQHSHSSFSYVLVTAYLMLVFHLFLFLYHYSLTFYGRMYHYLSVFVILCTSFIKQNYNELLPVILWPSLRASVT